MTALDDCTRLSSLEQNVNVNMIAVDDCPGLCSLGQSVAVNMITVYYCIEFGSLGQSVGVHDRTGLGKFEHSVGVNLMLLDFAL